MIKNFNDDIDIIEYFDGGKVPAYITIGIPESASLFDMLMIEHELNGYKYIAGYLEGDKFHYYDLAKAGYHTDFSKEHLVIFAPDAEINTLAEQHVIFNFISSPGKVLWFMTEDKLLMLEKTKATYKLCRQINKIFDDFTYFRIFMEMVITDNRLNTMNNLMDIMYVFNLLEPEKKILDWENHYEYILEKCFKLKVIKCNA